MTFAVESGLSLLDFFGPRTATQAHHTHVPVLRSLYHYRILAAIVLLLCSRQATIRTIRSFLLKRGQQAERARILGRNQHDC